MSDVNYFSQLTTTILPDNVNHLISHFPAYGSLLQKEGKRRSPVDHRQREGVSPTARRRTTCFRFSTFPPSELWECGNLACFRRDFQGRWELVGEACLWLSTSGKGDERSPIFLRRYIGGPRARGRRGGRRATPQRSDLGVSVIGWLVGGARLGALNSRVARDRNHPRIGVYFLAQAV